MGRVLRELGVLLLTLGAIAVYAAITAWVVSPYVPSPTAIEGSR